ncbi:MAG: PBP1A family penicillin-binding protein [Spirochaetes bacterium]|nr:PBP1A family penicillin-binding protein [Spirochaetota bacterium]
MVRYSGGRSRFSLTGGSGRGGLDLDVVGFFRRLAETLLWFVREYRAVSIGIGVGIIIALGIILAMDIYKVRALANFRPDVTTKIYDQHGVLVAELFKQKREVVPLNRIPPNLVKAFVSIEDEDFYDHHGVSIKGIVRAFFINIFSGRVRQGGSTITQQLAKILLTSGSRNIFRKIKEAVIALMIEICYTKDEIMSMYLNQIFLGHGAYGVESASRFYFNKHVWNLNLAECALLASLPSAPNRFSPIRHPKTSINRHKIVLARMVELGYVRPREAEKAYLDFWPRYLHQISDVPPTATAWSNRTDRTPWFTEYIRRSLVDKYGEEMVYEKGLLVYTTMDLEKQLAAQRILKSRLRNQTTNSSRLAFRNSDYIIDNYQDDVIFYSLLFGIPEFQKRGSRFDERINDEFQSELLTELDLLNFVGGIDSISSFLDEYRVKYFEDQDFQQVEGCIVSINHTNGYIEAMVGGSEFSSINQLNRIFQARRQPGSAIKPLLYTAAIESGEFTAATAVLDSPVIYLDNEGGDWTPENYEGEFQGFLRLRRALALSINIVSVRLADALGIDTVMRYYSRLLGFDRATARARIPRNFSIALGSIDVTPFELTRAYAIIANGGKDVIPFAIRYVRDRDGHTLENQEEEIRRQIESRTRDGTIQIIRPETAQMMISLLRSVIAAGTGGAANPGRPAGGKTGTTNSWRDAWFVGFTPELTTGVWVGYDRLGLTLGLGQSGGAVAAPIWGEYMRAALADTPVHEFPVYAGLIEHDVCAKSGLLPSSNCRDVISETFIPGTVPTRTCDLCAKMVNNVVLAEKGPGENISQKQKRSIISNIRRGAEDSAIDVIGDDLLRK